MKSKTEQTTPRHIIACPHCGWEYLPCEIFYPGSSLGKSDSVIRDALGKIIYEDYFEEPEFQEKYECDNCHKPFVTEVTLNFKACPEKEEFDFSTTTVSLLD